MFNFRQQGALFFIALGFLTRLPIPSSIAFSQQRLNLAARYFPWVGWLIGALCAAVLWLCALVFPLPVAVVLVMVFSLFLTGGFHEDGLADTCDGIGGGWSIEQKLSIMKDSRLGTYGALGLICALLIKHQSLVNLFAPCLALLVAHPLSRLVPVLLMRWLDYVQQDRASKVKPLAMSLDGTSFIVALIGGGLALIFSMGQWPILLLWLVFLVVASRWWLMKHLGGYTGDTLGAVQQVAELGIYLVLLAAETPI